MEREKTQLKEKIHEGTKEIVEKKEEITEELGDIDEKIEALLKEVEKLRDIRGGLEEGLASCEREIKKEENKFS